MYPPRLTFGVLAQPTTYLAMESVQSLGPELALKWSVDFRKKRLIFEFPVRFRSKNAGEQSLVLDRCYRVEVKFGAIKDIHQVVHGKGRYSVVINLEDPPLIWKKKSDVKGTFVEDRLTWAEHDLWQRAVDITPVPRGLVNNPVSLNDKSQVINLGCWMSYWIELDEPTKSLWSGIETNLRDWNVKIKSGTSFETRQGQRCPKVWAMLDDESPAKAGAWGEDLALVGAAVLHTSLRFDVRYQLEVCISHGIINEYNIEREFIEKLIELSSPERLDSERGRLVLEYAADQGKRIYQPMDLFSNSAAMTYFPTTMIIPDYCALIRKVTITPTKIYFNTPTVETTNRVIRHFKHVKDNFIRLQFTDELLEGRINGCEADRDDQIYARAFRVLNSGVRMGRWHWKFLAFGNSQIRESGAFFFCEPEAGGDGDSDRITCGKILKWMGRFNHIKVVAKYAARIGQCFSTTRLVPGISAPRIAKISDVERGQYCFTDGVGKISPLLAQMIAKDWQLDEAPSAYQFRMGGCKGVLVSWPDVKDTEVHIRKSQEKFFAVFNGLEVIRCSQFSCATLNRQTITILSCLGVPDHAFVEMMAEQVSSYNDAMTDKHKAVQLLEQFIDENQITISIAQMLLNGFMDSHDPFVQTVIQLWRAWSIKSLKEKARLTVNQGAFVLGCVDETGTLQGHFKANEGQREIDIKKLPQIFLQVPDPNDRREYKVITGLCVVGRNPSLHPGDIRVVNAVDAPSLRHIRDAVVFPLKGDRDIPSMCSGGDLDGDDFFVIWDERLIPQEWCHAPMNYKAPEPVVEPDGPTIDSLKAFFVLYMKNNNLPLIAHAHLAMADYEDDGAKHDKCKRLAELHSVAVDYVKTGVPAEWSRKLEPRRWPHFMEKAKRNTYHSTRVLGKLYDMVKRERFDSNDNYKLPFDPRILNKFNLPNELLKKARQVKTKYDIAMRRVMGQLEIDTEFEVWTTFVLSRPRVGTAYKLQEKVGRESAALKQQYRDICVMEAGGSRDFDSFAPFVAAMYRVTWEELRIALYEARQPHVRPDGSIRKRKITARSMPLITFPWLFDSVLGKIAMGDNPGVINRSTAQGDQHTHVNTKVSKPHGHAISILDHQPEELAMDVSRTNDGQVIHRGEILHLFQHDDDDEDDEDPRDEIKLDKDSEGGEGNFTIKGLAMEEYGGTESWSLDSRLSGSVSAESQAPTDDEDDGDEGDDDLAGGSTGEVGSSPAREVTQDVSTPKMRAVCTGEEEEEEQLISLYTPSPRKKAAVGNIIEVDVDVQAAATLLDEDNGTEVTSDSSGAPPPLIPTSIGEDGSNPVLEEYPGYNTTLDMETLEFPPSISPPSLLDSPLVAGQGDTFSEPECGYDEVVLEVEEESALERVARLQVDNDKEQVEGGDDSKDI